MAVATDASTGSSSTASSTEPASGEVRELREPATGEPLAHASRWRGEAGRRPRGRGAPARRSPGRGGRRRRRSARASCTRSRTRSSANRKELAELETRNVGKAISSVKAELTRRVENFRFYASAIALDRRALEPARRLAALLLAEGAGRRRGPDRALELPADDGDLEARAGARRRLRRRAQARPGDAADGAADGRAGGGGRLPAGRRQRRPGRRADDGRAPRPPSRASTRSRSPARPRPAARSCGSARSPIKRLTLELGGKSPNLLFADAELDDAIPSSVWSIYYAAGQSCEARSRVLVERPLYDEFVAKLRRARGQDRRRRPARRRRRRWARSSRPPIATRCTGSSRRAVEEGAEVVAGGEPADGARRVLPADRARAGRQRDDRRAGGDLRPRRDGDPVRGREGRDPDRERRPVRPLRDGLDGRRGARATGSRARSRPG